jgi:hypothetical protein
MRTNNSTLYDNSLAGILARLTHGILQDAGDRAQRQASHPVNDHDSPTGTNSSWLDRLDTWFWKQELKERDAFLAQSIDIFDLEQRMRCLERGDRWLGSDRIDATN